MRYGHLSRRWLYPLISWGLAITVILAQPIASQALPWGDLILRGIQVIQIANMSDRQEIQLGQAINSELVKRQIRLYRDPDITQYVAAIGQRVAAQSQRPQLPYVFQVIDSQQVNAFATLGGYVYVNTGLLKLADNEAELASVLSHEVGHIAARHVVKKMKEQTLASGVASLAGVSRNVLVGIGVQLAMNLPHSRAAEYEADQLGLISLQRSGYAPSAMPTFMAKLLKSRSVPEFLSSHPATEERVKRLEQAIDPATADFGDGLNPVPYRNRMRSLG